MFLWLIPVPGWWHFEWHTQKAIFRLYGNWLLTPLAFKMGRTPAHIDKTSKVKNFRSTDEFLVNFTTASLKYFNSLIDESGCADMPAFLEHIHRNSNFYDVGYLTFYTLVPYVQMCSAVRLGDWRKFESLLPVWLQLFVASDKTKYRSLILSWT